MRTVFLGTSEFAASILERLAASEGHRPALVLTRPDRPRGRGQRTSPPPVAERARALGLALEQPASVNDPPTVQLIAAAAPDVLVVCAFGALIKDPLLSEHDVLNVHPSLLPRWRGAAPIERAIMAGDDLTGVSIMRLTEGLDSGPVCLAASEPVGAADSYGTLAPRLCELGGELLLRVLERRSQGRPLPFTDQPEQGVTYAEKIGPEDRLLDPARSARELERVVRALHPHVGARAELPDGTLLGVHRAALLDGDDGAAARTQRSGDVERLGVSATDGRLVLGCSPGVLELLLVQPAGGRAMDAESYLRGRGLPQRR